MRVGTILSLAIRDLRHGWRSSACLIIATAAALAPLLILFGLYFGVVSNMIERLTEDPRVRELSLVDERILDDAFFDEIRRDPDLSCVLPRTRYLASIVKLRARNIVTINLLPTDTCDPLLDGLARPDGMGQIVLSERAAIDLQAKQGDQVEMLVGRNDGARQVHVVTVTDILPRRLLQQDAGFVRIPLLEAVEVWREGEAVPELGWDGSPPKAERASYAGYRLYADDVRKVPALRDRLMADGSNVKTRSVDVENALLIESALGLVFLIVACLASIGYALTLGLHLAAAVVEKSRELSVLRLLGMSSREISVMPSLQGAVLGACGALLAGLVTLIAAPAINGRLEGLAGLSGQVFRLDPLHVILAILATAMIGIIAGLAAGGMAARLEPSEGLRHY